MTLRTLNRLYLIGYSTLLVGTVLISISRLVGGLLFFSSIGLIILASALNIHRKK